MTYTFPLNIHETREILADAVDDRGDDFVYVSPDAESGQCLYWHEKSGGPGCGVGEVAYRAGVPVEDIKKADAENGLDLCIDKNRVLRKYFDLESCLYLQAFQNRQDAGAEWGDARESAEDYYTIYVEG